MDLSTLIGAAAAFCSTTSFLPQAWKIIRTRDTSGISVWMYVVTVLGFGLWLAFGWLKNEWPLIVTNAICLGLATFILTMKVLPQGRKEQIAGALDPQRGQERP